MVALKNFLALVSLAAAPALAAAVPQEAETLISPREAEAAAAASFKSEALRIHNKHRADHGVPALTWSDSIAAQAKSWASQCKFAHSVPSGEGQNIAASTGTNSCATALMALWYDEQKNYDYSTGASKNGQEVLHFTQVVWKSTKQLGCAVVNCPNGLQGAFSGASTYLVCNYSPPGNYAGEYKANVLKPKQLSSVPNNCP